MELINKEAAIKEGFFYPKDTKKIYMCSNNDTKGFIIELFLYGMIFGIFAFWLIGELAIYVSIFSWFVLAQWIAPRRYKYIQMNYHTIVIGSGSLLTLIFTGFSTFIKLKKYRYDEIEHILLDRWVSKKKKSSFGQIEIKIKNMEYFKIQIADKDLRKLIEVLSKHRFSKKAKPKKVRRRNEFLLLFPNSAKYDVVE